MQRRLHHIRPWPDLSETHRGVNAIAYPAFLQTNIL